MTLKMRVKSRGEDNLLDFVGRNERKGEEIAEDGCGTKCAN